MQMKYTMKIEYKKNVQLKANKGMEFQRNGFCWSPHNSKSARIQLLFSFEMNKQSKIFNDRILLFKNNSKIYIILFACLANGHTALLAVCPLFPELCLRVCLERILQSHTLTPFSLSFSLSLPAISSFVLFVFLSLLVMGWLELGLSFSRSREVHVKLAERSEA